MWRSLITFALIGWAMLPSASILAEPPPKLATELFEKVAGKFGREITEEGAEVVVKRLALLGERCGADAFRVFEHAGPKGLRALEAAGPDAVRLAPVLAQHGKEAAWLVAHSERAALVLRHGEVAAKALIRHRQIGEAMIREWGQPAARAMVELNPQNGRRLAMLLEAGQPLAKPDARRLLGVIADHGNPAMDFVWRNKGALTISACFIAFVNDPKPFLMGGRDLVQVVGQAAVQPVTEAACEVSREVNWTVVSIVALGVLVAYVYLRFRRESKEVPLPPRQLPIP